MNASGSKNEYFEDHKFMSNGLQRKGSYAQPATPALKDINHGTGCFKSITVDFVHMPSSKTGKRYIVTIMDNFSRWLYCHPTVRDRAEDAVSALISFILENGIPDSIESDSGVHCVNNLFSSFCEKFKINQKIHCAYRPQSSGALKRVHRTLKNSLFILVNDHGIDWPEALMYARYAHNVAFNSATKSSPFSQFLAVTRTWRNYQI